MKKAKLIDISDNGYIQGILYCLGSYIATERRMIVRSVDKFYCEQIAALTGNSVWQTASGKDGKTLTNKIASVSLLPVYLQDVTDVRGFLRAVFEIRSVLDTRKRMTHKSGEVHYLRLRVYGDVGLMRFINMHMPPRSIQTVKTNMGTTHCISWQSGRVILNDIFPQICGTPRNEVIWNKWDEIISTTYK